MGKITLKSCKFFISRRNKHTIGISIKNCTIHQNFVKIGSSRKIGKDSLNILKERCILNLIKTILFNFFSSNTFTNTIKRLLFIVQLSRYPIAIMNILNECVIDNDIVIMGYSVCVTLCRLSLNKHNW